MTSSTKPEARDVLQHQQRRLSQTWCTENCVKIFCTVAVVSVSSGDSQMTSCRLACQWWNPWNRTRRLNWTSFDNLLAGTSKHTSSVRGIVRSHCVFFVCLSVCYKRWYCMKTTACKTRAIFSFFLAGLSSRLFACYIYFVVLGGSII